MARPQPAAQKPKFGSCARKFPKNLLINISNKTPILVNFVKLSTILCPCCLRKHIFISYSAQTPWNLDFQWIFVFQKSHLLLKLIFRNELRQRPKFDIFQKPLFCFLARSRNLALKAIPSAAGQYF